MSEFSQFLSELWRIFDEVQVPGIGISFAQLWVGCFVLAFAVTILRPIFGLGASAVSGVSKKAGDWYRHRLDSQDRKERKKN